MPGSCTKVKAKKYLTRKSPPYHAGDCRGQTRKGGNGANWTSRADSRGVYRWIPAAAAAANAKKVPGKLYKIHDNGGVPFKAYVEKSSIQVTKMDYETNEPREGPVVFKTPFTKLYIGQDPRRFGWESMTPGNRGNTLLVEKSPSKYVFIGWKIQEFQPVRGDEILKYESPVGNNDVPYPFAVGKDYTYLMIEEKYIPNEVLDMSQDPYKQYYGFDGAPPAVKKAAKQLQMKTLVRRA